MKQKFNGNFVMTTNSEVETGEEYCYYESMPTVICNVKVIDMHNDENGYGFSFEVTVPITKNINVGDRFSVGAAHGNYAYGGMWRLYNKGEYK